MNEDDVNKYNNVIIKKKDIESVLKKMEIMEDMFEEKINDVDNKGIKNKLIIK